MNVGNQKNHKIKDKQMVLKKLSQFCMIAILCMATLFNFGVNPPSVFASELPIVLSPSGGTFTVYANDPNGTTVVYPGPEVQVGFLFETDDNDTWCGGQCDPYTTNACGDDQWGPVESNFQYPDLEPKFAMVADCTRGDVYSVCETPLIPFLENEECKFVMNDAVNIYGDNSGEIEVIYTLIP